MSLSSFLKSLSAALFTVLFCSVSAFAANLNIAANGDRSYSVQGSAMDDVAGVQLDIIYDSTSLSSPSVTKGDAVSGAMLAANTNNPGSIRIAIISSTAFSGNGQIATISFAGRTGTGGIISATVNMINSKGATVASSVTVAGASSSGIPGLSSTPGVPFSQTNDTTPSNQSSQNLTAQGNPLNSGVSTSLGTVTFSSDQQQRTDTRPAPSVTPPVSTPESIVPKSAEQPQQPVELAADAKQDETPQYVVYKGILDRFKLYDGGKKLASVETLFDKKIAQTIQQSPAIMISNGQDRVKLAIDIPARIKSSPNFAVSGGSILSFKQDTLQKGHWIVEVLPETGTFKATVTIIAGVEEYEYPLTVAPPVKTTLTLDEKGWDAFVSETGATKILQHDFNNDGVRNYIDEYIFAANIIAKKMALEKTPPPTPVPTKQPVKAPPTAPPKTGK